MNCKDLKVGDEVNIACDSGLGTACTGIVTDIKTKYTEADGVPYKVIVCGSSEYSMEDGSAITPPLDYYIYSKIVDEAIVEYKGERVSIVPEALLTQQDCWENLDQIKELHIKRLELYDRIKKEKLPEALKALAEESTEIEFKLQELWKFKRNRDFHKFWELPKCECPVLDNDDRYPYGYYVITCTCPLHGS